MPGLKTRTLLVAIPMLATSILLSTATVAVAKKSFTLTCSLTAEHPAVKQGTKKVGDTTTVYESADSRAKAIEQADKRGETKGWEDCQ